MRNPLFVLAAVLIPGVVLAAPVWSSNFESGDLSAWTKLQAVSPDRAMVVDNPAREGTKALRVHVQQGDDPINSGNDRAELVYMTLEPKGTEYYYRWSVMFPDDYPSHPKWQLFTQWHQEGLAGTPPLEIYVAGEQMRLRAGGHDGPELWTAPLKRGAWQDFILRVKWSDSPSEGFVELYVDGQLVLPKTMAATQLPGQLNYFKLGLYRAKEISAPATVYFDDVRMGTTMEDVMPPQAAQPTQPPAQEPAPAPAPPSTPEDGSTGDGVVSNPTVDPEVPGTENGQPPTPEELAAMGCSSSGSSALPLAAVVLALGATVLVRRRRTLARVTLPARQNRR